MVERATRYDAARLLLRGYRAQGTSFESRVALFQRGNQCVVGLHMSPALWTAPGETIPTLGIVEAFDKLFDDAVAQASCSSVWSSVEADTRSISSGGGSISVSFNFDTDFRYASSLMRPPRELRDFMEDWVHFYVVKKLGECLSPNKDLDVVTSAHPDPRRGWVGRLEGLRSKLQRTPTRKRGLYE